MKIKMKKLLFILIFLPFIGFGQSFSFGNQTGCVSGNCLNGYGLYVWPNGDTYEGFWINGKRHGKGTFTYDLGTFVNGRRARDIKKGEWINDV